MHRIKLVICHHDRVGIYSCTEDGGRGHGGITHLLDKMKIKRKQKDKKDNEKREILEQMNGLRDERNLERKGAK